MSTSKGLLLWWHLCHRVHHHGWVTHWSHHDLSAWWVPHLIHRRVALDHSIHASHLLIHIHRHHLLIHIHWHHLLSCICRCHLLSRICRRHRLNCICRPHWLSHIYRHHLLTHVHRPHWLSHVHGCNSSVWHWLNWSNRTRYTDRNGLNLLHRSRYSTQASIVIGIHGKENVVKTPNTTNLGHISNNDPHFNPNTIR